MTDHTDLIKSLRRSYMLEILNWDLLSEAADALEAAQAEIEAQQHRIQSLWMERDVVRVERDKALACLAKLEPRRDVSPPSEELVLHKMRYHFWEADDDGPADFELFDAGVECDTCIDVALVRQDRLDELIAAAGASPQPSQDLSLDLLERLSKTLTRLGYATPEGGMEHFNADLENQLYNLCRAVDDIFDRVQPSQGLQSVADALTIEQLNDKVERLMAVQPSQAGEPPRFPTMLRKMWSGSEVQDWINANWGRPTGATE